MDTVLKRIGRLTSGDAFGAMTLAGVCALSAFFFLAKPTLGGAIDIVPGRGTPSSRPGDVALRTLLSQTKLVQGDNGVVTVEVNIDTPTSKQAVGLSRPMDLVVVLDRSGSMAAENRLPYAKAAIRELISSIATSNVGQRSDGVASTQFALVSFDDTAKVEIPLASIDAGSRDRLLRQVDALVPGGGTNMGAGLQMAQGLISTADHRLRKVILLSDGEANVGISDPSGLADISATLNQSGAVVSSIGMGLGFNEVTLSRIADRGAGNFSYLESLASLGTILDKDLKSSLAVYAQSSELEFTLPQGVKLEDASGYPIRSGASGDVISTGQLLSGQSKRFYLTLRVPTDSVNEHVLKAMTLRYQVGAEELRANADPMMVAVLPPAKRDEAVASIAPAVYQSAIVKNTAGIMKDKVADSLRRGDQDAAKSAIEAYAMGVTAAEKESNIPMRAEAKKEIDRMNELVSDSFVGAAPEQAEKRNRQGKRLLAESRQSQRTY
ncbi:MAG: VWA domain-containing protein [Deltaproteobacteria bacterium]|nr:VWA domain-containing protein [Deltaproteobacteria bacterium]